MTEFDFNSNSHPTLGVELELMLIDRQSADLKAAAVGILGDVAATELEDRVKLEITESMIEINSSVHDRHATLVAELAKIGRGLVAAAEKQGAQVCAGGTHPFHRWQERRLSPGKRFEAVGHLYGYLAKQFTVFGQHVHVGCRDGDEAVRVVQQLSLFVPHFIAAAAASPFYRGVDTAFESCRLNVVAAFPLSGRMPPVRSWEEFLAFFRRLQKLGIAKSIKDLYWDIRPKPEFGTVEVRVPDTPLDVTLAADLAAYAQCLVERSRRGVDVSWLDDYVYRYNRFQAARFGFEGQVVVGADGARASIADHLRSTLDECMDDARRLECEAPLRRLADLARTRRTGSAWLREQLARHGSLPAVVLASSRNWSESLDQ